MKYVVVFLLGFIGTVFGQVSNTIYAQQDELHYDTDGVLLTANGVPTTLPYYNVLGNDSVIVCPDTHIPATLSPVPNVTFTATPVAGSPFVINPATGVIPQLSGGGVTAGIYYLEYTICNIQNPSHCITVPITIFVDASLKTGGAVPPTTHKQTVTAKTTATDCSVNICFNDANLKYLLTDPSQSLGRATNSNGYELIVDANGDGEISYAEALQVGQLNASTGTPLAPFDIADFTGLQYFTNMKVLNIAHNNIVITDYSVFPSSLERFIFWNNPITTFDSAHFPNLKYVKSSSTPLSLLDFGGNHQLVQLETKNCPNLTSINIKNGINQMFVDDFGNPITDCWSNCPNLTNVCVDASEMAAVQNYLTNCGHDMSVVNVNSTCALGVESVVVNNGFTITPNPSTGVFTVAFNKPLENAAIEVFNLIGQSVMRFLVPRNDNNVVIELTNYPSGVYLMVIESEQGIVKERIIKN